MDNKHYQKEMLELSKRQSKKFWEKAAQNALKSGYLDSEVNDMEQQLYSTLGDVVDLVDSSGAKTFVHELFTVDPRAGQALKEAFDKYEVPANYGVLLNRKG